MIIITGVGRGVGLGDGLILVHLEFKEYGGCASIDLRFDSMRLACNDLDNNTVLGSSTRNLTIEEFLVLWLTFCAPWAN